MRQGVERRDTDRQGRLEWQDGVRPGTVRRGSAGKARRDQVRIGRDRSGEAWQAGVDRRGCAARGLAGHGEAGTVNMTGSELKKLRKKLGLSLAQAARQVEVTPRTWARWEAGDQAIPEGAVKLFRILNKLDKVK